MTIISNDMYTYEYYLNDILGAGPTGARLRTQDAGPPPPAGRSPHGGRLHPFGDWKHVWIFCLGSASWRLAV